MLPPPLAEPWRAQYRARVDRLRAQLASWPADARIRLAKPTSNLFRPRTPAQHPGLDVSEFSGVLHVDPEARIAEVLGMTTYEDLVDAALPFGLAPMCVPQLRTITIGGAVTGLGIESASFRQGSPHESVLEMDILTGTGEILTVTPADGDPHRDLFFGFPNSYGSLGYALRLRIELEPVLPYVELRHVRFDSGAALAAAIAATVEAGSFEGRAVDFIDGTVFTPREQYLTLGFTSADLPAGLTPSDYTGMDIYYRSIQRRTHDVLTTHDYLWRWDTDWFWCSRAFGAQHPLVRRLWPKDRLRSDVYWRLVALDRRYRLSARSARLRGKPAREPVVQDIEVPVDRLAEFLAFFHEEVGISPIWVCPLRQRDADRVWPLYEFDPTVTYVNVGFWSTVPLPKGVSPDAGTVNRRIEQVVTELDGRKSLYSTAFYDPQAFRSIYGGDTYDLLKRRYDPDGRFPSLYAKVVERQ